MSFRFLQAFGFAAILLSQAAYADTRADATTNTRIGIVDLARVMRESQPAQRTEQRLKNEFSARDADLQRMGKDVIALKTELENKNISINEIDRRKKEQALDELGREFERKRRVLVSDINIRRNEELKSVYSVVNRAIRKLAESERYDLIIHDAVYYNKSVDLTDKAIKALATEK